MPKKQKSKTNSKDFKPTSKPASDEPVYDCVELDLKPPTSRSGSKDDDNNIDDKYAALHWSDAFKLDIHEGEPALIAHEDENDASFITSICKVRISPSASSGSASSTKNGTPLTSKRRSIQETTKYGEIILSSNPLYQYFLPIPSHTAQQTKSKAPFPTAPASFQTPPASTTTKNASFTSPSKLKFSFAKGGGGDSLLSPSPSKYTSPSGSKFSFSKGGGGDCFLSPGQNKTPNIQSNKRPNTKVLVLPLINLSTRQLSRLCPDAQTLTISSLDDESKLKSHLLSSSKIIQTLVLSKYKGTYIPMQFTNNKCDSEHTSANSESNLTSEIISISFRGQAERFRVINVTPVPVQDQRSNQRDDLNDLSNSFDRLDISRKSIDDQSTNNSTKQKESRLMKFLQSRIRGQKEESGSLSSKNGIACRITTQTKICLMSSLDEAKSTAPQTKPDTQHGNQMQPRAVCAGLDSTLSRIKDALLTPLLNPNLFPEDGPLRPPKGALLFGPAGVGKSLLAAQIANELNFAPGGKRVHVRLVQCADILSNTAIVGEAEKLLTGIFEEAERKSTDCGGPIVILDDVHLICPRRGGMGGGSSSLGVDQLAGTLLALLDGIGSTHANVATENALHKSKQTCGGLVVLAITTEPSLLDPALRRPGRLDVEVEVPVPDDTARAEILNFHLSQIEATTQQLSESDIKALARLAKGFTGADCKLAVKEAVRTAISCSLRLGNNTDEVQCAAKPSVTSGIIKRVDLEHAIRITKPSAIKSVAVEVPKVPWSAIGGMEHVKSLLKESIELPLTHPHLFELLRVPPPKGILLYGPPGCSKTLMARAIATEGNMNFLAVKGPELLSKWLGESERALASLFRRARLAAPSVIFFDEMDAIASKRGGSGGGGGDRLLSQLLTELDGVTSGGSGGVDGKRNGRVVVVGATNRPDVLDAALTRPGRMDKMIYVGLPDERGREGIFKIGLSGKDCHDDVDISALACDDISNGYSGAEIIALCRDAALHAITEMDDGYIDRPQIHMEHLIRSINDMKPRTTKEMLDFYKTFRERR